MHIKFKETSISGDRQGGVREEVWWSPLTATVGSVYNEGRFEKQISANSLISLDSSTLENAGMPVECVKETGLDILGSCNTGWKHFILMDLNPVHSSRSREHANEICKYHC